jgi:flagella basal body P-ring formation protein FlgA
MSKLKIFIVFSLISILMSSASYATTLDREYLKNFVKLFIEQELAPPPHGKMVVTVSSIDPRVIIKDCLSPLVANIPEKHNGRNVNVKLSCNNSVPWHLYIPVRITTTIPVIVAKGSISKGSRIDESNIEIMQKDLSRVRGESLNDQTLIIGARAKRKISNGNVITRKNICLVCKGQHITIIAQSNTFMIKTSGIALKDGGIGEQVRVKNEKSGRIVTARVKAINQVVINL